MPASRLDTLLSRLRAPVDGSALAVFRALFGAVMGVGCARTVLNGWVETLFVDPTFFFKYPGFGWVAPWPGWGMHAHYWALSALALCVAIGFCYRASIVLFTLGFAYAQLIDVTNYLNHYYLVVLLGALMTCMPLHRTWSVDAWLRPSLRSATAPAWCLYLLRFQYATVYVYAGAAKIGADWLLHAQPLGIWMASRDETPLLGPWLREAWVAYAMSWIGCVYDLTIALWLSWRRTRLAAFAVLLTFHTLTFVFWDIGLFPFIMTTGGLLFFPADWPRRLAAVLGRAAGRAQGAAPVAATVPALPTPPGAHTRLGFALAALYCAFQIAIPLRHLAYPGDVLWDEQGMRWSWKVLVREKNGAVTFRVRGDGIDGEWQVSPARYLRRRQEKEMWGQPDLILQLAHRIAEDARARGVRAPEVRVEAPVSLNGRPPRLMIDPERDLAAVEDGLARSDWILPAPAEPPFPAGARGERRSLARRATAAPDPRSVQP